MASVVTPKIDFPLRKLRSRSKATILLNESSLNPSKKVECDSLVASPPKRKPLTPKKSWLATTQDVGVTSSKRPLLSSKETGPENANPNLPTKPLNSAKKNLQLFHDLSVPKEWTDAKTALTSGQPDGGLVGRYKQTKILRDFLSNNFEICTGKRRGSHVTKRSLYVSGPPGTGKTTLLNNILSTIDGFQSVFVNCMSLRSSKSIFSKLAESLGCETNSKDAQKSVEKAIVASKVPILMVLDEVDQLDSKGQTILYTIYEWPYLENSRLTLVGIANSLDLTDRMLPRLKLREEICPQELTFPAYSKDEIYKIITSRLEPISTEVISPGAIRLLAAKFAALSGDVRKALDVCRRALELAELEAHKQTRLKKSTGDCETLLKPVELHHVLKVINEVYCSSAATTSLKTTNSDLPTQQKIIVASLLLMTNYGSRPVKEVTLGKLHETYAKLCRKRGMTPFDFSEVASLCSMLEARGFFGSRMKVQSSQNAKDKKLSLRIDEDEVEFALKDKTLLSGIISDVDCIVK